MHVSLLVPAPFHAVSGGYEYDRRIVAGLRDLGHAVDVIELPGRHPIADHAARDGACAAWDRLPAGTVPVIDGLALPAFDGLDDALRARGGWALCHHPVSLETGLAEDEAARLGAVERRLLGRMKGAIATSEPTRDALAKDFGLRADALRVVVPGTDAATRVPGSGGATCEVLSIGTLIPRKGHDLLLAAMARLFDLDWRLTIVGSPERDPAHAASLAAMARDLGIERRVVFAGETTGAALDAIWARTDLFATGTHFEGYGMAIAEAMARGIPVVATGGGAVASLIPMEAGMVCPVGDRDQLSKSLRRAIFSRELRAELAEAAWAHGRTLPGWADQAALFAQALGG